MNTQALKPEVYDQLVIKRILSIMEQKQFMRCEKYINVISRGSF